MIDSIGGRKVFAALLVIAIGVATVFLRGDLPPGLLSLLQVVFGALVAGNAMEHVAGAMGKRPSFEETVSQVNDDTLAVSTQVADILNETNERYQRLETGVATVQETLSAIIKKAWG